MLLVNMWFRIDKLLSDSDYFSYIFILHFPIFMKVNYVSIFSSND